MNQPFASQNLTSLPPPQSQPPRCGDHGACQSRCAIPWRARLPSGLRGAFEVGLTWKPVTRAQGFERSSSRVGMPRRKRKKVEATEATDEAAKVDIDMGDAGKDQPSPGSEDSPTLPHRTGWYQ